MGDSLPFGRPEHGISRDETWPYLLSNEFGCGLQMRAMGGATMVDVAAEASVLNRYWFEGLKSRSFDITIIQAGIVDCCPRLLPRRLYKHARRCVPGFRNLERSPRAARLIGRPWVSASRFAQALSDNVKILSNISSSIFFLEIAKPAGYLIQNVGDFSNTVSDYNGIIQRVAGSASFVAWQAGQPGQIHVLPDGHHLTLLGHQAIAKAFLNHYGKHF